MKAGSFSFCSGSWATASATSGCWCSSASDAGRLEAGGTAVDALENLSLKNPLSLLFHYLIFVAASEEVEVVPEGCC